MRIFDHTLIKEAAQALRSSLTCPSRGATPWSTPSSTVMAPSPTSPPPTAVLPTPPTQLQAANRSAGQPVCFTTRTCQRAGYSCFSNLWWA